MSLPRASRHNGLVAGRIGWLVPFFTRAEPREPAPSGWALAFDVTVAVGAAAGAVYEMAERSITLRVMSPGGPVGPFPGPGFVGPARTLGGQVLPGLPPAHASVVTLIAAALTALPLAARRF
jgi:hypothetical protein